MLYEIDDTESRGSMRCTACDASFHPVWYEDEGRFEELCPTCLSISLGLRLEDDTDDDLRGLQEAGFFLPDF